MRIQVSNFHRLPRRDDPRLVVDVIAEGDIDAAADTEREPLRCLDHDSATVRDTDDDYPTSWTTHRGDRP